MSSEPDAYLAEHVRDHLARDPRTNELEARVTIAGEKVFISGIVATEERRDAVGVVAAECVPDHEVVNQTTVADYPAAGHAEHVT